MGCFACKLFSSVGCLRLRPEASSKQTVLCSVQGAMEQLLCDACCQLRGAMHVLQGPNC